jgi:calcineurin-like phosphoesterase
MRRFITGMSKGRFIPAEGSATLSGLFVETDDRTGKAQVVKMIRHGGLLEASAP